MGFVNRSTGAWNRHEWNWPDVSGSSISATKPLHIETAEDAKRKRLQGQSTQAISNSPYYTPDQKSSDQSRLRSGSLYSQPRPNPDTVFKKRYTQLKLCEANMAMYLNSLMLDIFDTTNPVLQKLFAQAANLSDEQLGAVYDRIVNTYNKKSFDPDDITLEDGNGQQVIHSFKTIKQSKSSPSMPDKTTFIAMNKASGIEAAYKNMLAMRGY